MAYIFYATQQLTFLAQALKRLYKDVKVELGIGPVIENGFYYDIDMEEAITVEDFKKIEKKCKNCERELRNRSS